jgi:Ser/Thr protein kinase RdoA (MazF antagonist)
VRDSERDHNRLAQWLASRYDLPDIVACRLLRSYTNDVFLITTSSQWFVLKIYGRNWRTQPEIAFEIDLLRHLSAKGLAVASPVEGRNGFIQPFQERDGESSTVLFEYAPGAKPQPPFTTELYAAFGRAIGAMHELSSDFATEHHRPVLDLEYLLDKPLAHILPLLSTAADRTFLTNLGVQLKEKIAAFALQGLEWGVIHGDATLDNLHVTAEGKIILYDFDSGGYGWRAADLQGWAINKAEYRPRWEAFSAGYASVRPLHAVNVSAAPAFTLVWDIWGMEIDLHRRILGQGAEKVQEYLAEQMAVLRSR